MFAEVYPLTRLPRRFTFFDYEIPEALDISAGDLVRIRLKGRSVIGIIKRTKETTDVARTSAIESVAARSFFSTKDIERIEAIARAIFQSPSSVFTATLMGWKLGSASAPLKTSAGKIGSLTKEEVAVLQQAFMKESLSSAMQLSREGELALLHLLRKRSKEQILILCPREREAELVVEYAALGPVGLLHGKTTPKERQSVINGWREGRIKTLVGTRQAVLLPAKKLEAVIVLDSGSEEYAKLDRNPRFDARTAARLLAEQHDSSLIFTGPQPRLEDVIESTNNIYQPIEADVIDLNRVEERSGTAMLSNSLIASITAALSSGKKALLIYNKKGTASGLQCAACGHIPFCGTCGAVPIVRENDLLCPVCSTEMWIPKQCPACKSDKLKERGIGNARLKQLLGSLFPSVKVALIDKEHVDAEDAQILIVTEYFFKNLTRPFDARTFGVVADLAFDLSLLGTDFRSAEQAAYKLHRNAFFARRHRAPFLIQAWNPEIARSMIRTKKWLKTELNNRKTYDLPPFSTLIRVLDKSAEMTYKNSLEQAFDYPDKTVIQVDANHYD